MRIRQVLAAAGAVVGLMLAPLTADAAAPDGQDPIASGCSSDAYTASHVYIYAYGVLQVGIVENRFSPRCGTKLGPCDLLPGYTEVDRIHHPAPGQRDRQLHCKRLPGLEQHAAGAARVCLGRRNRVVGRPSLGGHGHGLLDHLPFFLSDHLVLAQIHRTCARAI